MNVSNKDNITKYVFRIFLGISLLCTCIIGALTIVNNKMYGEAWPLRLSLTQIALFIILLFQIMPYFFVSIVTKKIDNSKAFEPKIFRFQFTKKINIIIFVLLMCEILFTVQTGIGKVGGTASSNLSWIFALIKLDPLMLLYTVNMYEKKRFLYWINILTYFVYQLICGWTGFVLTYAILIIYLFSKDKRKKKYLKQIIRWTIPVVLILFLAGAFLYQYLYVYKTFVRYGYYESISFIDSLSILCSRFTNYPITVTGIQNHSIIAELYRKQGIVGWEAISVFRSLTPSFLMPNKTNRIIGNVVLYSIYPEMGTSNSTGYNIFIQLFNLLEANPLDLLLWILMFVVCFIVSIKIIRAFDSNNTNKEILIFLLVFKVADGNSIENMFGYGYLGILYALPLLWILGGIKIYRTNSCRKYSFSKNF